MTRNSRLSPRVLFSACAAATFAFAPLLRAAPDFAKSYETAFRPVLVKYCVKCHGGEKTEAKLDLAALDTGDKAVAAPFWSEVLERVGLREMPPAGARP